MSESFPFEKDAFNLLIKLEQGLVYPSEIIAWADKKLELTAYDDALANVSLSKEASLDVLKCRLKKLIRDYPKMYLEHEAVEVAQGIIDESIHLVFGCGKLTRIVRELGFDKNSEYLIFCCVDSEADGFPLTEQLRAQWNKDALKRKDEEYKIRVAGYLSDVKGVCRKLINELEQGNR